MKTPPTGNLLYSDVEDDLRASVRALLEKSADWASVLARTESAEPTDRDMWRALATDIGCAGLSVPEPLGGAGASWREVAVVSEELGRAVAPVPFLGSVVATALLLELVDPAQKDDISSDPVAADLLGSVAAGERVAALAVPAAGTASAGVPDGVTMRQYILSGSIGPVLDAGIADVLLVPAQGWLFAVEVDAPGVTVRTVTSLDMTRPLAEVILDGAPAQRLVKREGTAVALPRALQIGAAILASEQLGLADRCFSLTLEYVKLRYQFGRQIGSFQAVKHRLADLWVELTQARAVARYAAECAASGSADLPVAAALAQARCSEVALHAAEECVQLHGGIGFTWEHPAHLYLKRAKADSILFGTAGRHRAALAELMDLPGAALSEAKR